MNDEKSDMNLSQYHAKVNFSFVHNHHDIERGFVVERIVPLC